MSSSNDYDDIWMYESSTRSSNLIPSDVSSSLEYFRNNFPYSKPYHDIPPIILVYQLYSLLVNHTEVDTEIHTRRADNTLRMFKLSSGKSEFAVCFTEDLLQITKNLLFTHTHFKPNNRRQAPSNTHKIIESWWNNGNIDNKDNNSDSNGSSTRIKRRKPRTSNNNDNNINNISLPVRHSIFQDEHHEVTDIKPNIVKTEGIKTEKLKEEEHTVKSEFNSNIGVKQEPKVLMAIVKEEPEDKHMYSAAYYDKRQSNHAKKKMKTDIDISSNQASSDQTDSMETISSEPLSSAPNIIATRSNKTLIRNSNNLNNNNNNSPSKDNYLNPSHPVVELETSEQQRYIPRTKSPQEIFDENLVFYHFLYDCLPQCTDVSIQKELLIELVYEKFIDEYQTLTSSDSIISILMQAGLISMRAIDSYWFLFINSGELINEIINARKEIYTIIKRKKYQEMLLYDLYKIVRLKSSERGIKWHLREMIGGMKLDIVQTTIGPLVRINKAVITK